MSDSTMVPAVIPTVAALIPMSRDGMPTREWMESQPVGTCVTSLPAVGIVDKLRLLTVLQAKLPPLKDGINLDIEIVHVTVYRDCGTPADDEVAAPYTRYIITDASGEHHGGSGVYMIADLEKLRIALGDPPYDPPIPVRVTARKCQGSHTSFNLVPDVDRYLARYNAKHANASGKGGKK